jgi:hypothetical protein
MSKRLLSVKLHSHDRGPKPEAFRRRKKCHVDKGQSTHQRLLLHYQNHIITSLYYYSAFIYSILTGALFYTTTVSLDTTPTPNPIPKPQPCLPSTPHSTSTHLSRPKMLTSHRTPLSTPRVTRRSAAAAAALNIPATPGFRVIDGKKVSTEEADVINANAQLNREARMAQKSKRARRRARAASRKREIASPVKKA